MNPTVEGQEWLVLINRDDRRLMSTREVRAKVQAGLLARETLVWRAGMSAWESIGSIGELASQSPRPAQSSSRPAQSSSRPAQSSSRPTMPRRSPGYNPRLAETMPANRDLAQRYAPRPAPRNSQRTSELVATGATVVLTVLVTSYALYSAGVFDGFFSSGGQ
jgi:hypothetical protein